MKDRVKGLFVNFGVAVLVWTWVTPGGWTRQPNSASDFPVPPGVRVIRDLEYRNVQGKALLLDLYLPEKGQEPFPVIVWIHGGGWRGGSKDRPPAAQLAAAGYAVASINYRLSGEAQFPAQIEDCRASVRWLRAKAASYRLDANQIGAWGTSAGGHLAALLGTAAEAREWDQGDHLEYSSRVQAVCDFFGPTDFLKMDAAGSRLGHDGPDSPESRLMGAPIREIPEKAARANPICYVAPDDPPFLIVHGDRDELVPLNQSELLCEALKKASVETTLHVVKDGGHGHGLLDYSGLRERVKAFFDRHLKQQKPSIPAPVAARVGHYIFKKTPQGDLTIQVHFPEGWRPQDRRPAIVFFFGGGWIGGSLQQFLEQSRYLSLRGMVAAQAEYRVKARHGTTSDKCVEDGKSAIRWVREHAERLGVDPNRIAGGGGSAGGHVAAAAFTTPGLEAEGENHSISSRPNLLVLFNPVFDATIERRAERVGSPELARKVSPLHNLSSDAPPSLLMYGAEDALLSEAQAFVAKARELRVRTVLYTAEGEGHGFFNRPPWKEWTLYLADRFLSAHGYLQGQPAFRPPAQVSMEEIAKGH